MNNHMTVVGIVTGALILFVTLIQLEIAMFLIWILFMAGPFLVMWMVYSVLVAPIMIEETFEEQWYQDQPDMRRVEGE